MKNAYLIVLVTVSLTAFNAFGESEMDSEINDLQVKIIKIAPKPKAKPIAKVRPAATTPKIYTYTARPPVRHAVQQQVAPSFYKPQTIARSTYVASTTVTPTAVVPETRHAVDENGNTNTFQPSETEQTPEQEAPKVSTVAPKSHSSSSGQILRRVELLGAFTTSSFDGGDSSNLIPGGVSSPYNSSLANVMLLTDIDFGSSQFFIESGLLVTQMGSGTGEPFFTGSAFQQQNAPTSEKVTLTYVGVPLNLKWRLAQDEHQSSFFAKAGAIPMYMASHAYQSSSNYDYESRFGAYNTFDILFDLGIGYDINVGGGFHGIIDVAAYQGMLPVLTNYSVFNYGLMAGLGAAYVF